MARVHIHFPEPALFEYQLPIRIIDINWSRRPWLLSTILAGTFWRSRQSARSCPMHLSRWRKHGRHNNSCQSRNSGQYWI